jgi:hexokinase
MMSPMSASDEAALARAVVALEARTAALDAIARDFQAQMARGLAGEGGSLKMLRTFTRQPTGRERGRVVAVDWGGTRGRAGLVELAGGGSVEIVTDEVFTFPEALKQGPAGPVFDVIADAIGRVVEAQPAETYPLGFVYSYPARLERIDRAVALALTKGWSLTGLEGQDVAALLNDALRRRGLGRITVTAVANDTVAALMLQSYRSRGRGGAGAKPADIGLILGTGTNQAADLGPAGIRNLESGNFDGVAAIETRHDAALDRELREPGPGAQRFEKMVSGRYLGEVLRRVLDDLGHQTAWFHWSSSAFATPFAVGSEHLSRIALDRTAELSHVDTVLRGLGVTSTRPERHGVRELSGAIGRRAARLVATALLGTLRFLDPELTDRRTIAVDGSLWGGYPGFESLVRETLVELIGRERAALIEIAFVKDSTSTGAAIIAAVAAQQRSERCSSA